MVNIGIIQHAPVHMDLPKSLDKAVSLIQEAAQKGAELILFGESWLSGYPAWLDHSPDVSLWDHDPMKNVFSRMVQNSIQIPGKETNLIGRIARKLNVIIGMGVNERINQGYGNGSLFNSLILFAPSGDIVVHHRKLMPTYTEKLLYGQGDGFGLITYPARFGRIGGLICWEHWMPHARQALHHDGELVHIALWPSVHEVHQLASRHYAFEGRCFVIAIGQMMKVADIPDELTIPDDLRRGSDRYILNGGSCIISPTGTFILEPVFDEEKIILYGIEPQDAIGEKMTLDTAGHYYRPDIFTFDINRGRPE